MTSVGPLHLGRCAPSVTVGALPRSYNYITDRTVKNLSKTGGWWTRFACARGRAPGRPGLFACKQTTPPLARERASKPNPPSLRMCVYTRGRNHQARKPPENLQRPPKSTFYLAVGIASRTRNLPCLLLSRPLTRSRKDGRRAPRPRPRMRSAGPRPCAQSRINLRDCVAQRSLRER